MASKDVDKSMRAWRRAEEAYARAIEPFLKSSDNEGHVTKKAAIRLSELRGSADSRLQKYLRRALK